MTVYTVRTGKPRPPRELLVGIARQLEYLTRRVEDIAARL